MSNKPAGWDKLDQAQLSKIQHEMKMNGWSTPMPNWITRSRVALWFMQSFERTDERMAERLRTRAQSLAAMESLDEYE